jgi:tRNA A37 methylthiotransferase MiaB
MMAPTLQSGKKYSDELEMEHDIRNLKETITALRDALEKQRAGTATEVSLAVAESQAQIRDLQGTISEIRTEIGCRQGCRPCGIKWKRRERSTMRCSSPIGVLIVMW